MARLSGGRLADQLLERTSGWTGVQWTVSFTAFLVYLFIVTTNRFTGADIAMAIAIAGLALERRLRVPPLVWFFAAYTLWCALGLSSTEYTPAVVKSLDVLWKLGLILLVAINAAKTRSQFRVLLIVWLGAFALYPVRGAYLNYFVGHYTLLGRAIWNYIYSNPNDLAALTMLQMSLLAAFLTTEQNRWLRRLGIVGFGVLTLLVFLTQSRGAIIGLGVVGLVTLSLQRKRGKAMLVVGALAIVVVIAAPAGVWHRLSGLRYATDTTTLREVDKEGSAEQRFEIWRTAGHIIADHPLFGVGLGAYPLANAAYSPAKNATGFDLGARDTHSTYLNVLAETGFPGLLLFLALLVAPVIGAERTRRKWRRVVPKSAQQILYLELGLLAFMLAGVWASYAKLSFLYLHLALIFAAAALCEREGLAIKRAHIAAQAASAGR